MQKLEKKMEKWGFLAYVKIQNINRQTIVVDLELSDKEESITKTQANI